MTVASFFGNEKKVRSVKLDGWPPFATDGRLVVGPARPAVEQSLKCDLKMNPNKNKSILRMLNERFFILIGDINDDSPLNKL